MRSLVFASLIAVAVPSFADAADLPVMVPAAIPAAPAFDWTGFYVGAHIGGRFAEHNDRMLIAPAGIVVTGTTSSSVVGGLHAGYNWQLNPSFLAGVEADVSYGRNRANLAATVNGPSTSLTFPGPGDGTFVLTNNTLLTQRMSSELDWSGSIRARLGITNDRLLVYATGGLALGNIEVSVSQTAAASATLQLFRPPGRTLVASATADTGTTVLSARRTQIRAGWTIGGGAEYALDQNWLVRGEYLYADYGRVSVGLADGSNASARIETHTARVGLSYRIPPQ